MCNKILWSRRMNLIETLLYGWWYTVVFFTYLWIYQINVSRHKQFLFSGGRVWPPFLLLLSAVSTHKAKQWTFKHIQSSQWHPTLNPRSWGHRLLKEKVQLVLTQTITGLKGKRKKKKKKMTTALKYTYSSEKWNMWKLILSFIPS